MRIPITWRLFIIIITKKGIPDRYALTCLNILDDYFSTPNLYTHTLVYFSPGRRTVDGKLS